MTVETLDTLPLSSVKKFYFLKYFFILLECVERYDDKDHILDSFKTLKQKNRLGESKYKKKFSEDESLTEKQLTRYKYTFEQIVAESKEYRLIDESPSGFFYLTREGKGLLQFYHSKGEAEANKRLFSLMEQKYGAFRYTVEFLYKSNNFKQGLLLLPNYPPSQLGIEKSDFKRVEDLHDYLQQLVDRFRVDFQKSLGERVGDALVKSTLSKLNEKLVERLQDAELISDDPKSKYDLKNHKKITDRVRDFWLTYFLQTIYQYEYSLAAFEIWAYRGKQLGVIHATEFYPNLSGRVLYPTSVIVADTSNPDFEKLYTYPDGRSLYSHKPVVTSETNQNVFAKNLYNAYSDLRRTNRSYFISVPPLREIVCYNMKISEQVFESFLGEIYKLNLEGKLPFSISLEVDRLPEETNAMYIKQEPVVIDGKHRNIIGIEMAKGVHK